MVEISAAEDWDNDEYTGSLSDTKVFTPSGSSAKAVGEPVNGSAGHAAPGGNYQNNHCNQSLSPNIVPSFAKVNTVVVSQVLVRLQPTTVCPTASQ